jgi:hypothetical protein
VLVADIDFDEFYRYVAHLQRQLVTEGTELWFDHQRTREYVNARRATIGESIPIEARAELVDEYVRTINAFKPSGPYDSASAAAIFQPLLERVLKAAKKSNFRTSRMVTLVTSPAIEATPYTISTEAAHVIFAGPATFLFCNYWAKVFASLTTGQSISQQGRGSLRLTLEAITDASRLAVYYAMTGTLMGFGVMLSEAGALAFRMEYVEAMELFALGHEFGHCVAHDSAERFRGMLTEETLQELELLCDRIGTATSRAASTDGSLVAFCGAGAVLIMYAHEICQGARGCIATVGSNESPRYPATKARVAAVRDQVISTTPEDQLAGVTSYLDDVITLCEELTEATSEIIAQVLP